MKVDLTIVAFILTFIGSCVILYLTKPRWVQVADDEGKLVVSIPFIVVYSLIFASLMAIITLVTFELDKDESSRKTDKDQVDLKTKFCGP